MSWLDLTAHDRTRMRRVLDLFTERGTIDELGLGALRDALSDALFPGTSSIQTRLRYALFVPWIYTSLERDRAGATDVATRARALELALIRPLSESEDSEGVIGARARGTLKRLPSGVYWAGLVRWGLFQRPRSQSWYHANFPSLSRRGSKGPATDDPGVTWAAQPTWHPRLPPAPSGFPSDVSFEVSPEEAAFLRDQIVSCCPGSLIAWLAAEGTVPTGAFWDEPAVAHAPASLRSTVELARRLSLHVEAAPMLYNRMLAVERHRRLGHPDDATWIAHYDDRLAVWAASEQNERPFDPQTLWSFMAKQGTKVAQPLHAFVENWSQHVAASGPAHLAADAELATLLRDRERTLKGARSRFTNASRLLDWSGSVGVGRMDFRWFRVRQLLTDLHAALDS